MACRVWRKLVKFNTAGNLISLVGELSVSLCSFRHHSQSSCSSSRATDVKGIVFGVPSCWAATNLTFVLLLRSPRLRVDLLEIIRSDTGLFLNLVKLVLSLVFVGALSSAVSFVTSVF